MAKREFLQLAHRYSNEFVNGWFVSEKLNGVRCLWDGGISRGLPTAIVPWANTAKVKKTEYATGLWSRYGKPFHAPDTWLDKLPPYMLDGELYLEGNLQDTVSIVKKQYPTAEWLNIKYKVFDAPSPLIVFADGLIDTIHYKIRFKNIMDWVKSRGGTIRSPESFQSNYRFILSLGCDHVTQTQLPFNSTEAAKVIDKLLTDVVARGGEGLMVRKGAALYECARSHMILKIKPSQDAEGIVVGYVDGLGKHNGRMGSVTISWRGVTFQLSGFTDDERERAAELFPIGSLVTFKYRDVTSSGVPVEARFDRLREQM